jgi:uncharacterized protein
MTDLYALTVPVFQRHLGALRKILEKAKANASERKFDEGVLVNARLAPDMFALARQVQIACDFAKGGAARLSQTEVPKYEDSEKTLDDLIARIDKTLVFVAGIPEASYAGADARTVSITLGGQPYSDKGVAYVRDVVMPHFYFHVVTAYGILRHNGLQIGKLDYLS